jgi:hypothetical protein
MENRLQTHNPLLLIGAILIEIIHGTLLNNLRSFGPYY